MLLIGLYWIPESPRYLPLKDRDDEALKILKRIHFEAGDEAHVVAHAEHFQIMQPLKLDRNIKTADLDMFRNPHWRKRCVFVIVLMFASQFAGVLGIGNSSIIIYQSLGMSGLMPLLMYAVH